MDSPMRFRNCDPVCTSLPNGHIRALNPETGMISLLQRSDLELLLLCNVFRTLEEHTAFLVRRFGLSESKESFVLSRLNDFCRQGLMIDEESLKKKITDASESAPSLVKDVPMIPVIGIPTANRPFELERLLKSLISNLNKFGHTPEIVVADDSNEENTKTYGTILERFRKEYKGSITHLDTSKRTAIADEMSERSGVPQGVARFALVGDDTKTTRCGAQRNMLLLYAAGKKILMLDDDVIINTRRHPQSSTDLILTAAYNNAYSYYGSYEASVGAFPAEEADYLAAHSNKLGRPITDLIKERLTASDKIVFESLPSSMNPGLIRALTSLDPKLSRVLVAHSGSVGESWTRFNSILDCNPVGPGGLFGSTIEEYVSNKNTPFVSRVDRSDTIYNGVTCVSLNMSLDNSEIRPPFPPMYRGQDNIFGQLMNKIFPQAFSFRIPIAIEHKRNEVRPRAPEPLAYIGTVVNLTRQAINSCRGKELRDIADHLVMLGSLPESELESLIREMLKKQINGTCMFAELMKAHHAKDAPEWWVKGMNELIASNKKAMEDIAGFKLFSDSPMWTEGGANGWTSLKKWLRDYGVVMQHWPAMFAASLDAVIMR